MGVVRLKDKRFKECISANEIDAAVTRVANQINNDLDGLNPVFLCVLNGAFMFASDLLKKINIDCEVAFVKVASYDDFEKLPFRYK